MLLGQTTYKKIITIVVCCMLTSVTLYYKPLSRASKKEITLNRALNEIKGWKNKGDFYIDKQITDELKLDDYVNRVYSGVSGDVLLYIGYYLTSEKVGAAHDPMVCFPGQGWKVSGSEQGELSLKNVSSEIISYSIMTVQRGSQKELILYWFQAYDMTSPDTFSQKLKMLFQRLFKKREDNAFVRISISVGEKSLSECKETAFDFIQAFYPVFLNYIERGAK